MFIDRRKEEEAGGMGRMVFADIDQLRDNRTGTGTTAGRREARALQQLRKNDVVSATTTLTTSNSKEARQQQQQQVQISAEHSLRTSSAASRSQV
jgi:Ran GTPase-activating protein (RanGAP) involved in mRNA processing and transport